MEEANEPTTCLVVAGGDGDQHLKEMGMGQASAWGILEVPRLLTESGRSDVLLQRMLPYLT